jgi:hypothetical protein
MLYTPTVVKMDSLTSVNFHPNPDVLSITVLCYEKVRFREVSL